MSNASIIPQMTKNAIAVARRYRTHPRTVLLLAGFGVTHEFVPKRGERPGLYGSTAQTAKPVVPKGRRERTRFDLAMEDYEFDLSWSIR